jgi:hypothetical protein
MYAVALYHNKHYSGTYLHTAPAGLLLCMMSEQVAAAVKWIKACPLASRPLVPSHVQLVTDEGIRALQQALPTLVSKL